MSANNLASEFQYIVQWFNEWSELQRDDFVPILVEYLLKRADDKSGGGADIYMNGVVSSVASVGINDKPMSLFQCRIKLFRQWTTKWPEEFKQKLKQKISEIDSKVGEKVNHEMTTHNQTNSNGNANGIVEHTDDDGLNEAGNEVTLEIAVDGIATAIVEEINNENRLINNETSVADVVVDTQDNDNDNANHATNHDNHIETPQDVVAAIAAVEPAEQVDMQATENVNGASITVTQTAVSKNAEVPPVA